MIRFIVKPSANDTNDYNHCQLLATIGWKWFIEWLWSIILVDHWSMARFNQLTDHDPWWPPMIIASRNSAYQELLTKAEPSEPSPVPLHAVNQVGYGVFISKITNHRSFIIHKTKYESLQPWSTMHLAPREPLDFLGNPEVDHRHVCTFGQLVMQWVELELRWVEPLPSLR